ncbi:MAG: helix-turn-helix domain-containing protein, partial [Gammaproteobacteria bacterium]|nr:helix-turn-helix domain-containing protein [Gammaproteobacteria bacterium]
TNLLDETPFTPLKLDGQQSNEREIMDDDQKNITGLASVFVDASDPVALGNAIRSARLDAGLSQTQLIAITNISLSTLSRIETGKTKPTLSTLSEIAKATNSKLKIGFTLL